MKSMKQVSIRNLLVASALTASGLIVLDAAAAHAQVQEQAREMRGGTNAGRGGTNAGRGGTNAGRTSPLPGGISDQVLQWCTDSQSLLNEYVMQALIATQEQDIASVPRILKEGIVEAMLQTPAIGPADSLTYRALSRGLELFQIVEAPEYAVDAATVARFMSKYYEFTLKVIQDLDMVHYVPHRYEHGGSDLGAYERAYVHYANRQIEWLLEQYVYDTGIYGYATRIPVAVYLKALEMVTAYSADDLDSSLWSAKFACVSRDLRKISGRLAVHNTGNKAFYRTDQIALNLTTVEMRAILARIELGCGR